MAKLLFNPSMGMLAEFEKVSKGHFGFVGGIKIKQPWFGADEA